MLRINLQAHTNDLTQILLITFFFVIRPKSRRSLSALGMHRFAAAYRSSDRNLLRKGTYIAPATDVESPHAGAYPDSK
jgi:hypothetical protein